MENSISEGAVIKGQPGLVMLPAREYTMKTIVSSHTFSIPIAGKFSELYPDFFELTKKPPELDFFETVFYIDDNPCLASIAVIEVLFAAKLYPDLEDNQIFSISSIVVNKKANLLHLIGSVLEISI